MVAKALGADGRALAMSASATDNHVYVRTLDYKNDSIKPWSAVRVSALVLQARLDVPYAATLTYEFADGSKVDRTSSGFFSGVNGYEVTTKFEGLGELAREVKVRRFDRLAGGALCDGAPAHAPALGASAGSAE